MLQASVFLLCVLASATCMWLLFRAWRRTGSKLLFWSALAFVCLALNNLVVFCDLVIFPTSLDLMPLRQIANLAAIGVLLWGFVWEAE
jgi:hypothetical protein